VFWDADVFVFPALAALRPEAARSMVSYRAHRIAAAAVAARRAGLDGARFPWESAADGSEVTPLYVGAAGHLVPVLTDDHEEHISADVAWAADRALRWIDVDPVTATSARRIIVQTGRYWASRLAAEPDPRHIRGVMGPDEYHDAVDDDAFTNVMARWNLRRAARELDDPELAARWRALADGLVDGWDPALGCHEQFAGYWEREPLVAAAISPPPFAADVLLGAERVTGSQLIKQPDVLMLHHMVPEELRPGSLAGDLAVYGPRTVHGSSLSPAIHSALHARASQPDRALALFRMAARLDLDDLTGTTAGGLHLATMGGLWQALAQGFLGIRVTPGGLAVQPCLPDEWRSLRLRFRLRGQRLGVTADHEALYVECEHPIVVAVGGRAVPCGPGSTTIALRIREERP
jgi:trehalose/maltose hydrolase-like predicted phosphorylase